MFDILSIVFRYLFIFMIYLFMFAIIRLIYLDIRTNNVYDKENSTYLKLINRKNTLQFIVKEFYLLEDETNIGRSNRNNIVIKDPYMSKEHAKITIDEGKYFYEDLDSANGSFINGDKVLDVVELNDGDRLKIGQVEFLFVSQD